MTARRLPCRSCKIRFSRVVLPLPKKPVITVTGTLAFSRWMRRSSFSSFFKLNRASASSMPGCDMGQKLPLPGFWLRSRLARTKKRSYAWVVHQIPPNSSYKSDCACWIVKYSLIWSSLIKYSHFLPSFVSIPPPANPHALAVTALSRDAALSKHALGHPYPPEPGPRCPQWLVWLCQKTGCGIAIHSTIPPKLDQTCTFRSI